MAPYDELLRGTPYVLVDAAGGEVTAVPNAAAVRFAGVAAPIPLASASGFKNYSLAAILLFALSRSLPNATYLRAAADADIQLVSFADRAALAKVQPPSTQAIVDSASNQQQSHSNKSTKPGRGSHPSSATTTNVAPSTSHSAAVSGQVGRKPGSTHVGGENDANGATPMMVGDSTSGPVPPGAQRVLGDLIYERNSDGYRIFGYSHPLFDRNSILNLQETDDKDFENIAKSTRSVLTHAKKTNGTILHKVASGQVGGDKGSQLPARNGKSPSDRSGTSHVGTDGHGKIRQSGHRSGKPGIPIIIVPNAIQSLLTIFNIKQFLIDGVYVPMETITDTFNKPDRVVLERSLPTSHVGGPRFPRVYHVIDSADNLKPDEWQNVVAAFVTGQPWQFKYWRYHDPVKLFDHVRGFNLRYVGDPLSDQVQKWAVRPLQVHRRQRHNDKQASQTVWEEIDDFIMKKKRDVFL